MYLSESPVEELFRSVLLPQCDDSPAGDPARRRPAALPALCQLEEPVRLRGGVRAGGRVGVVAVGVVDGSCPRRWLLGWEPLPGPRAPLEPEPLVVAQVVVS